MTLSALGIFSAAGAGGATGTYELIESYVLGSSQASVTFNVSGLGSTYKHLQIRSVVAGGGPSRYGVHFNGVSTSGNYASHFLYGTGSTVGSGSLSASQDGTDGMTIGVGHSTVVGSSVTDILDPFTSTKNTTIRSLTGNTGANLIVLYSGFYRTTTAVTSITLRATELFTTSFPTGSRFSLYGIRG